MEYNTQRPPLKISDYGRNIYKLIQYAKGIEDKNKRTQVAEAIVDVMARRDKEEGKKENDKRKYWVHLMILSDWELDVDMPYEISREETVEFKPHRLTYNQKNVRFRHYGQIIEDMVRRAAEYPEGEERDALVSQLAHTMKRDYLIWNRDTVEDEVINNQLAYLSGDRIQVPKDFHYLEAKEYLRGSTVTSANAVAKKKKKKKKKKRSANTNTL
jgi:predicted transposase YbfD/YdcC